MSLRGGSREPERREQTADSTASVDSTASALAIDQVYLAELRREFPSLRIVDKQRDALSRWIARGLLVLTLGAQRSYLTHYVTTLGATLYVPDEWHRRDPRHRYVTLRHEAVHLRQFRRYGVLGMSFLYAVPIFPLGLAFGRARLEWEAYRETLRATAEVFGVDAAASPELERHVVRQFTSGAYGWMWPFPATIRRWVRDEVARLRQAA